MLKIFLRLRVYLFYIWSTSTRKTSLGRTVVCELSMGCVVLNVAVAVADGCSRMI